MAALPLETPGPDTPAGVLAALESTHTALAQNEIDQFRLAVEWAIAHPIESIADIATVEGSEGELAIAGRGAPLVAEFCVADFALAIGVTTDAGRAYLGDAVEVRYRLPLLWDEVMDGRVPVWKARRIADHTHPLPAEAAAHVDQHLAPIAHRVSFAQIERTVEAARATFAPVEAEHRRLPKPGSATWTPPRSPSTPPSRCVASSTWPTPSTSTTRCAPAPRPWPTSAAPRPWTCAAPWPSGHWPAATSPSGSRPQRGPPRPPARRVPGSRGGGGSTSTGRGGGARSLSRARRGRARGASV